MSSNDPQYPGQPYPGPPDPQSGYPQPYEVYGSYDPYTGQQYPYPQQYGPYPAAMPPAYGYPQPYDEGPKGQAIGSLVTNIAMTLFCCSPLAIAGIAVSAMAMSRAAHQPASARSLIKWGWGLAIANVVLFIVLVVVYLLFLASNSEFN